MVKKVIGWFVFLIGCYLIINNIGAIISGSFGNILGVFLGAVVVWGGWSLAHPKSKEEIAKKKKEKEEGVV